MRTLAPLGAAALAAFATLAPACAPFDSTETAPDDVVAAPGSPGSTEASKPVPDDPGGVGGGVGGGESRPAPGRAGATGAVTLLTLAARSNTREASFPVRVSATEGEVWVALVSNGEDDTTLDGAWLGATRLVPMGGRRSGTLTAMAARTANPGPGDYTLRVRLGRDGQSFVVAFGHADGRVEAIGFAAKSETAVADPPLGTSPRRLALLGLVPPLAGPTVPAPLDVLTTAGGQRGVSGGVYTLDASATTVALGSPQPWTFVTLEGQP